jgi:DNA polymerase-1
VTKAERQLAKAVNFGLLYGQGARGLQAYAASSYEVEMSLQEATLYREAWFAAYPAFRRWHQGTERAAKRTLAVRTPAGRERRWSSANPKATDGFRVTEAFNTPVQGGAAEAVPVHGRETPICAYAAMGSWPI